MNPKPTFARPHIATSVAAAVLAALISLGLLGSITGMFQRDGTPFEQVVIAERACADQRFVSERELCVRAYLSRLENVASC
jgi:hypothetical protein